MTPPLGTSSDPQTIKTSKKVLDGQKVGVETAKVAPMTRTTTTENSGTNGNMRPKPTTTPNTMPAVAEMEAPTPTPATKTSPSSTTIESYGSTLDLTDNVLEDEASGDRLVGSTASSHGSTSSFRRPRGSPDQESIMDMVQVMHQQQQQQWMMMPTTASMRPFLSSNTSRSSAHASDRRRVRPRSTTRKETSPFVDSWPIKDQDNDDDDDVVGDHSTQSEQQRQQEQQQQPVTIRWAQQGRSPPQHLLSASSPRPYSNRQISSPFSSSPPVMVGETMPLFHKMRYLQQQQQQQRQKHQRHRRRNDDNDNDNDNGNNNDDDDDLVAPTDSSSSYHSTASTLCGFVAAWVFWVMMWILLLAEIMHIHHVSEYEIDLYGNDATEWTRLDRIYFATSVFWTVGGTAGSSGTSSSGTCNGGNNNNNNAANALLPLEQQHHPILLPNSNRERCVICGFVLLSLGFWALALGQWGNAVLEAYKAASMVQIQAQQRVKEQEQQQQQRQRQARHSSHRPSGLSLALAAASADMGLVDHNIVDGDAYGEDDYGDENHNNDHNASISINETATTTDFVMFPGLPWLLVQSIFCTAISIFCVFGIQFYEQRGDARDAAAAAAAGVPTVIVDDDEDAWNGVSTLYYFFTTAYTVGMGDVGPITHNGKLLAVIFVPMAVATTLHWIVWMAQRCIQRTQRNKLSRRDLNLRLDEFYEHKLQNMGLVDAMTFVALKKEYETMAT